MKNYKKNVKLHEITTPTNEMERVLKLAKMNLDYTKLQENLKDLNKLAAQITGTRISFVNLIDAHTQWSVSNFGYKNGSMPREEAICNYTIKNNEYLEIPELKRDERFARKNHVASEPYLNYYCGIPLTTNGQNIGALCVADTEPKKLSAEKIEHLKIVARAIENRLQAMYETHKLNQKLERAGKRPAKLLGTIRGPIAGMVNVSDIIHDLANEKGSDEIIQRAERIKNESSSLLDQANKTHASSQKAILEKAYTGDYLLSLDLIQDKLIDLFKSPIETRGILFNLNISGKKNLLFPEKNVLPIMVNLISNSMKFTPKGGRVSVELTLKEMKKYMKHSHLLYISVQDTGVGIGSEEAQKMKSPDIQTVGNDPENTDFDRYSFSLHLVKDLVQALDAELRVWSARETGTHVEVFVPLNL